MTRFLLILFALFFAAPSFAQEAEEETRSRFTRFVENQLSSENRQIRLRGIEGALSSEAVIGEITIADREGVWLRIVNARIDWSRSALLRGRLDIETLAADRIEVIRKPLPEEGAPAPEAGGFSLPELPLEIRLGQLTVPEVAFGQTVFGLESVVSVNGGFTLADGALEYNLAIERLDGPGGSLTLAVAYSNETEVLDLDLALSEPEDGILANLLSIEGRPAVDLRLAGSGPIGDLEVELTLDADGDRLVAGVSRLQQTAAGLVVDADVEGNIARLVAPAFRDFFGNNASLTVNALVREEGGVSVDALSIETASLSLSATGETSEDNFLRRLRLEATLADPAGEPVILPVAGGDTRVREARLLVDFGADASENWSGTLQIAGLSTATLAAEAVDLAFGGIAANLDDPESRRVTFRTEGAITGIVAEDEAVASAIGDRLDLVIDGAWSSGTAVELAEASLTGEALALELSGAIEEYVFDGTIGIVAESIAPFAELANRPLQGAIDLAAEGTVAPISGAFDLTFDGSGEGLEIGTPAVDALIESTVTLSGRLARGEDGFEAGDFTVENEQFSLVADGVYSSERADLVLDIALADLALVTDRASGRIEISGTAQGEGGAVTLDLQGSIPSGELAGRALAEATFGFNGSLIGIDAEAGQPYGNGVQGVLEARAFLDGEGVALNADILATPERRVLDNLDFRAGGATITGAVEQNEAGLLAGGLRLSAPEIETLAALALQDATGSAEAAIALTIIDGRQDALVSAELSGIEAEAAEVGQATIEASIEDLFGVPKIDGSIEAADIVAGGTTVETLSATAEREGTLTGFNAAATLQGGTDITVSGELEEVDAGFRVALAEAELTQGATAARLVQPAEIVVEGERIEIGEVVLDVDGGEVRAAGTVADTLDLELTISALPLAIANTVMADLDAAGTLDGTARITGPRDRPDVAFDIDGNDLTAAPVRELGLGTVDIDATGRSAGGRVEVDATLAADGGINVDVSGSVPIGEGELDLAVSVAELPLETVDALAGNRGLSGRVTADAQVSGTIAAPLVAFDVTGSGVTAGPLREFGVDPLSVIASGRFADQTVTLSSATVENGQGISVTGSGSIPIGGSGLDISVQGSAPLALANIPLAERGTRVEGSVNFDLRVTGAVADPQLNGNVAVSDAALVDPDTNVQLQGIDVAASISGQQVTINTFRAGLSTGGAIVIGGTISLDAAAGFPADIDIVLEETRYADGEFLVVTASGNLSVTGPLTRDPLVSGTVNIDNAEIGIPEGLGGANALTDVVHIAPPPDVVATLDRADLRPEGEPPVPTSRPSVVRFDITVNANNQIFVRGRGLDAELGGSLRLTGPATSIEPVGAFELIRGRLSILGRRIVFDDGSVTLIGDLDPFVNLSATSQVGDTTVIITVSGRASDIQIDFSSQPELPEDEVISRLIFERGISELSAFQIAQLAAAVAELTGGQNTSLLGQLRDATGLDDLDVVTDEEGNAALRAGRYLRDNVYLGVQAGSGDSSEVTIDLDITENLKARGAAGADGETSLGIFYERDY